MKDDDLDLGRYETAARWEPKDPFKKQRERYRKQQVLEPDPADSMLEMRPPSEWVTRGRRHRVRPSELFGSLWREGEVAVLFGYKGSGKSILAVQIAEDIARGRNTTGREWVDLKGSPPCLGGVAAASADGVVVRQKLSKVLYVDFQRTKQQFAERYSAPSPIPGKLPLKCQFKFTRAQIEWDGTIPPAFKNDLDAYLQHSIRHKIDRSGARVVIVDDISYLARNTARDAGCIRVMKTLKLWATAYGLSILVIAHMKGKRKPAAITLEDIGGSRYIGELADSVFAIGRSTFGHEYRYVKHLASLSPIAHDESNLLTYRLGRNARRFDSKSAFRTPQSAFEGVPRRYVPLPRVSEIFEELTSKIPLLTKEGWPRFADGVVLSWMAMEKICQYRER